MPYFNRTAKSIFALCTFAVATFSNATVIYDDTVFPGDFAFADEVVSYTPGANVSSDYANPSAALGAPDSESIFDFNAVSLGMGGELVVKFTDNVLSGSNSSSPDLHIFEIGSAVEPMSISISNDANNWFDLGTITGQPTSIDLDSFGFGLDNEFNYVRIIATQDLSGSPFPAADIDAIGVSVPEPAPLALMLIGLGLMYTKKRKA